VAAYCLFDNLEVNDVAKMEEYKTRVAPIVRKYGGRYVVLGGKVEVVEGTWRPAFPVMIEFPTLEHARRWYHSEEYRAPKAMRHVAGRFSAVFIEGLDRKQSRAFDEEQHD
jgi:uncharacterized protein (DUF1330 family)